LCIALAHRYIEEVSLAASTAKAGLLKTEGLHADVRRLARRKLLTLSGGAALAWACGARPRTTDVDEPDDTTAPQGCGVIPDETGGPYPADGSNGVNVLNQMGIVRSDIRSSFGAMTGVAQGVPLVLNLKVADAKNNCSPLSKRAVYLWHATRDGRYSLYTDPSESYLRGLQEADDNGVVRFQSIFPGCYDGRIPHIHFEVFPSLAAATSASGRVKTSQFALPSDACSLVYKTAGYEQSVANFAKVSLSKDMVFSDGFTLQMPTVSGSPTAGFEAWLTLGVSA
jgi:protocatechuate 3,4-dioxygenase beta subunit